MAVERLLVGLERNIVVERKCGTLKEIGIEIEKRRSDGCSTSGEIQVAFICKLALKSFSPGDVVTEITLQKTGIHSLDRVMPDGMPECCALWMHGDLAKWPTSNWLVEPSFKTPVQSPCTTPVIAITMSKSLLKKISAFHHQYLY